jgi:hypothetical protein
MEKLFHKVLERDNVFLQWHDHGQAVLGTGRCAATAPAAAV